MERRIGYGMPKSAGILNSAQPFQLSRKFSKKSQREGSLTDVIRCVCVGGQLHLTKLFIHRETLEKHGTGQDEGESLRVEDLAIRGYPVQDIRHVDHVFVGFFLVLERNIWRGWRGQTMKKVSGIQRMSCWLMIK